MFGQLTSLQNFFVKSAKNVYSKTVNRLSRNRQADNQNRNMPNSVELNVNVNTNVNIIHKNFYLYFAKCLNCNHLFF